MVWNSPKSGLEPFNRQMRKKTREIHSISDALVNAKLVLSLGDNTVWAEGLLAFYEIVKFLETAATRLNNSPVSQMMLEGLQRTEAFEADLAFYLGAKWADKYVPRKEVVSYLQHLMHLEEKNPVLLIAYIYHLYMGLLSGGQILRRKRMLMKSLWFWSSEEDNKAGYAVTDFGKRTIYTLKKEMVNTLNDVANGLSDETRAAVLDESCTVFELNNILISSLTSARKVLVKKLLTYLLVLFIVFIFVKTVLLKQYL